MTPTSNAAYEKLVSSGKAASQRAVILKLLTEVNAAYGMTRQEIVKETGLPINAVCGRVKELLEDEHVQVGKFPVVCSVTGNRVEAIYGC